MKPCLAVLLSLLMILGLTGCGSSEEDYIFRYDIAAGVNSLDPQFTTRSTSRMVIGNAFEGLLVQEADGSIVPGAAEEYSVSPDGRTYTFRLREDASWSDGSPVTADDFLFAFERMFTPGALSPFAGELISIGGAGKILEGAAGVDALQVRTEGEKTLIITLEEPNGEFPMLLTSTYAVPCKRSYFEEQRGRYGMDESTTLYNGPFVVRSWDNKKSINLRKNPHYASEKPVLAAGVNLYVRREDPRQLFLDGKSDAVILTYEDLDLLEEIGATYTGFDNTAWLLLFNQSSGSYGEEEVRRALSLSLDREAIAGAMVGGAAVEHRVIPPAICQLDPQYQNTTIPENALLSGDMTPRQELELGLQARKQDKLERSELLVCDTRLGQTLGGIFQKSWKEELNAYINLQPLPLEELLARVRQGQYQMALAPLSNTSFQVGEILGDYTTGARGNVIGLTDSGYDALIRLAGQCEDPARGAMYLAEAEKHLIETASMTPIYRTTAYYASAKGVEGIQFSPLEERIRFKYAVKS